MNRPKNRKARQTTPQGECRCLILPRRRKSPTEAELFLEVSLIQLLSHLHSGRWLSR
ncbi:hypothetical protein CLOSTMETH_02953 [[Clostridium] methylpentosum DSM 5476]|uniref:Uncharacterized protein n=1 Tax=[Clostridium] methylpentosum DSM 5476 TaxID=537013 RepID=C0EGG0_9FIRM|nr:hypothetical protein CLOSTMETH_02953 [[Clostridium] methylpentosum DSM 5476]